MTQSGWFVHATQITLALLVGIATACQPAINAKFAQFTPSRLHGGVINFVVGLLAMLAVSAAFRTPIPSPERVAQAPWWAWIGGCLGAFFVTMSLILLPKMGAAAYLAFMIAGQLFGAALIDHFGLLDVAVRELTWGRALGIALMIAGVVCIRLF
jgi:bacterial/archaeal transporter family-2 protein